MEVSDLELRAIELFNRSAAAHGFTNAPFWRELADQTRETWIEHARKQPPFQRDA
jgi:hypothetical protein